MELMLFSSNEFIQNAIVATAGGNKADNSSAGTTGFVPDLPMHKVVDNNAAVNNTKALMT